MRSNPAISYGWKPGVMYHYSGNLKIELGRASATFLSSGFYQLDEKSSSHLSRLIGQEGGGQGSGTAFVVHADGLLVTCAHVVRGATKVDVSLGGKTYSGDVVGIDDKHDLALVRVAAKGLPALPLAKPEAARLAEEVRAIGFPLSDVLGNSVKVTRGSISGLVTQKDEKLLQIDASINPGNSGGPLVNDRGEVLGVNSAGLVGESVTNVGFAVPIEYVWSFLRSKGISPTGVSAGRQLDGPALAAAATPSVALVSVNLGAGQPVQLLKYSGNCHPSFDDGSLFGGFSGSSRFGNDEGQLLMLPSGDVVQCTAAEELPMLMMLQAEMAIEKLPEGSEREWEHRRVTSFTMSDGTSASDSPFMPGRFGRPRGYPGRYPGSFPGAERPQTVVQIPATAHVKYRIKQETSETIEIEKTVDLMTIEREGQTPRLQIVGDGTLTWDKAQSVPKSLNQSMTMAISAGGNRVTAPMEFKLELYSAKTLNEMLRDGEKLKSQLEAKQAADKADRAAAEKKELEDAARKQEEIIAVLKANRSTKEETIANLQMLRDQENVDRNDRDEIAQILELYLTSREAEIRRAAIDTAEKFGKEINIATLIKLTRSTIRGEASMAIRALGDIGGSEEAARVLGLLLANKEQRSDALHALQKMGPLAEDPALAQVGAPDLLTHCYACDVIEDVGGVKSLQKLKSLPKSSDTLRQAKIDTTISQIERRLKKLKGD